MNAMMIALAALALAACTDSKEQSEIADAGLADAESSASADAGASAPDASSATDCDSWCGVRAPKEENEGWCPIDGFGKDALDCGLACEALAETEPAEPLQHCIEEDALCFVVMEQCILGTQRLADCTTWCEFRTTEHADEGFCEPSLQGLPDGECESVCIRALQDELPSNAVQECVRNNPLCFVDLAGCASP